MMESNEDLGQNRDVILPMEIIRMVLSNFGRAAAEDQHGLEELKKCRLISPKFYGSVQKVFRGDLVHKFASHFDGLAQSNSYIDAAQFGENLFGEFQLDFSTLVISHSEIYLLKTWLENVDLTNIRTLELTDNPLNWRELIQVLKKFPNLVNLELSQTTRRSEQLYVLFYKDFTFKPKMDASEVLNLIKNEVVGHENGNEDFLPKLKSLKMSAIHPKVMNIFAMIVAQAVKCELEDLELVVPDIPALIKSYKLHTKSRGIDELDIIGVLKNLVGFSKSLKTLIIDIPYDMADTDDDDIDEKNKNLRKIFSAYFMEMFSNWQYHFAEFKSLEKIFIDFREGFNFIYKDDGFMSFIKRQENLKFLSISSIKDQFLVNTSNPGEINDLTYLIDIGKFFTELFKDRPDCTTLLEYSAIDHGFEPIMKIPNSIHLLHIKMNDSLWRFSDFRVPIFPNCKMLSIELKQGLISFNHWPDFDVQGIIKKFPKLTILLIADCSANTEHNPNISNEDFQLILNSYPKMKNLGLLYCCKNLGDVALTGLTLDALELRKNDPNLPIRTQEISGRPISHLKKLEELSICKSPEDPIQITDLSLEFGFEDMNNLKSLSLHNTQVTSKGMEIIKGKIQGVTLDIRDDNFGEE